MTTVPSGQRNAEALSDRSAAEREQLRATGPPLTQNRLYRGVEDLGDAGKAAFRRFIRVVLRADVASPERKLADIRRDGRRAARRISERLPGIVTALEGWDDEEVAFIGRALAKRWEQMSDDQWFDLDPDDVIAWIAAHADDPDDQPSSPSAPKGQGDPPSPRAGGVAACIELRAPGEVRIVKRMPQTGAQKIVFEASWQTGDAETEVVVKRFLGQQEVLLRRELLPHPLAMTHPNIVEVHKLTNRNGDPFLVERKFPFVLSDTVYSEGAAEAATALTDLARAAAFLHSQFLVHGDIKPDNIAYFNGRYILLDFGICRPVSQVLAASGTGSLRTRAPELLVGEPISPMEIDVWSLGATVYNLIVRRFPLIEAGERVPRVWDDDRDEFENTLADRVQRSWSQWVTTDEIGHPRLRSLLAAALERRPANRPTASELLAGCVRDLEAVIGDRGAPAFPADVEQEQLRRFLATDRGVLAVVPEQKRKQLVSEFGVIERAQKLKRRQIYIGQATARVLDELLSGDPEDADVLREAWGAARQIAQPTAREKVEDELLSDLMQRLEVQREQREPVPTAEITALRAAADSKSGRGLRDGELGTLVDELEQFYEHGSEQRN